LESYIGLNNGAAVFSLGNCVTCEGQQLVTVICFQNEEFSAENNTRNCLRLLTSYIAEFALINSLRQIQANNISRRQSTQQRAFLLSTSYTI